MKAHKSKVTYYGNVICADRSQAGVIAEIKNSNLKSIIHFYFHVRAIVFMMLLWAVLIFTSNEKVCKSLCILYIVCPIYWYSYTICPVLTSLHCDFQVWWDKLFFIVITLHMHQLEIKQLETLISAFYLQLACDHWATLGQKLARVRLEQHAYFMAI